LIVNYFCFIYFQSILFFESGILQWISKNSEAMTHKTIISGRLEFGKSYDKVIKMYQQRLENFYRTAELMVKPDEIFDEATASLDIPRLVTQSTDKSWQNTLNLFEYVAQYAVAGDLRAWATDNGKIIKYERIEPHSDKVAVQAYLKGRELVKTEGKQNEARETLSSAIEKFERHALAYERRGYVNFLLKNYTDAMYDYTKSIDINPNNGEPYIGRALVKMKQQDIKGAITDLDAAIKCSIPLQPIYWKARRMKGECHLKFNEFESVITELKFFTTRAFAPEDSNYKWRQKAWFNYGKALQATGKYAEAVQAFDKALGIADSDIPVSTEDIEKYREAAAAKSSMPAAA